MRCAPSCCCPNIANVEVRAGPKPFATETELIARIESVEANTEINLASYCSAVANEVSTKKHE